MGGSFLEGTIPISNWYQKHIEREAKKDVLPKGERIGVIVGIVFIIICIVFFATHLTSDSGFFTSDFGALGAALFFGAAIYGIFPQILKFMFGTKNRVRPFEFIGNVLTLIAGIYFISTWPFDFTHLADILPGGLQPVLSWISNELVQILLIIGIPILAFFTFFELMRYFGIKKELEKPEAQPVVEPLTPT